MNNVVSINNIKSKKMMGDFHTRGGIAVVVCEIPVDGGAAAASQAGFKLIHRFWCDMVLADMSGAIPGSRHHAR